MMAVVWRTIAFLSMLLHMLLATQCGLIGQGDGEARDNDIVRKPANEQATASTARCTEVLNLAQVKPLMNLGELEKRFLDAHNKIRDIYQLPKLSWDSSLAAYAQRWADHQKAKDQCRMKHRSHQKITEGKSYGENLAYNWISTAVPLGVYMSSPEKVVKSWSGECKDYSYGQNSCRAGEQCGHFTQVVWHSTRRVGCAVITCDGNESWYGEGRLELWVCNYDPPGNYIGQWPY